MDDVGEVGEASVIGRILDKMNGLHKKETSTKKYFRKSFPEEFHPRKHQLYISFTPNNDLFFRLRSQGVPVLTAYFLCEPANVTKLYRQLQEKECLQREDALFLIKNI
uniref:Uncharacterized protein n=1 Tax=viral metagenome TaxID=1070528 RepID=A0A6C0IXL2_9ZZZZ